MLHKLLANSRYLIIVAVVSSLLATITLLFYGAIRMLITVGNVMTTNSLSSKGTKALVVDFIEIIDLFLLGTVFTSFP